MAEPAGPGPAIAARVTDDELDATAQREFVERAAAGAVVAFSGVIRNHDGGRDVRQLRYEAHPGAEKILVEVATELAETNPVHAVAVEHRVGDLRIGDVALLCTVSASHRAAAFRTCSDLVDAIKRRVPIWKHQHFTDGTSEWVGL